MPRITTSDTVPYGAIPFTSVSSVSLQTRLSSALSFTTRIIKANQTSTAGTGTYDQPDSLNAPGCRRYIPSAADMNVTGPAIVRISATTMEPREIPIMVVPFDPYVGGWNSFLAVQQSESLSTRRSLPFTVVSSSGLQTRLDASALTFTVRIIKADGTSVAGGGTVVQPDSVNALGCCFYVAAIADVDTVGETIVRISATGMEPRELVVSVVAYDPYTRRS